MKNTFYILWLFCATVSAQTFTIVPLDERHLHSGGSETTHNKYFKDVNTILIPYLGVWQWTEGNRDLKIYLYQREESLKRLDGKVYKQDGVFGYYVYSENGVELLNTKPKLLESIVSFGLDIARAPLEVYPTKSNTDGSYTPPIAFLDYSRLLCLDGGFVPRRGFYEGFMLLNATTARISLYGFGTQISSGCEGFTVVPTFPIGQTLTITKIASVAPPLP